MRLNPRKNEYEAVIALMESEDYETADLLAKAIVIAVAEELSHRDTTGIAVRFPGEKGPYLAVGPFYHKADVENWRQEAQEAGLETRTARLSSPDCLRPPEAVRSGFCECGHQREQHVVYGKKGKETAPRDCGVCDKGVCKNFTQRKEAA
jgi:hypothetical protein